MENEKLKKLELSGLIWLLVQLPLYRLIDGIHPASTGGTLLILVVFCALGIIPMVILYKILKERKAVYKGGLFSKCKLEMFVFGLLALPPVYGLYTSPLTEANLKPARIWFIVEAAIVFIISLIKTRDKIHAIALGELALLLVTIAKYEALIVITGMLIVVSIITIIASVCAGIYGLLFAGNKSYGNDYDYRDNYFDDKDE